jgi:hypothetical protein
MQMQQTIPVMRIFEEAKAREFYLDFLGFTLQWEHRFGDGFRLYWALLHKSSEGFIL